MKSPIKNCRTLPTRILTNCRLPIFVSGLLILTASSMAAVTYDSDAGTFTGAGTYEEAVNVTTNLTATPDDHEAITFTNNLTTTGQFKQNGAHVVFDEGTTNSFGSFLITNNGDVNDSSVTLKGNLTLGALSVCQAYTSYVNIQDGASLSVSGNVYINEANGAQGILNQSGGTVSFTTSEASGVRIGHYPNTGWPSEYNLRGGTLNILNTETYLAWDGCANMTISGGTANLKGLSLSNSYYGKGILNLTGGTLSLGESGLVRNKRNAVSSPAAAEVNLGQGTINAAASHTWGSNLTVTLTGRSATDTADVEGGATTFNVDEGKTITVDAAMTGVGALTKTGAGTLNLTAANTFSGKTTVSGGTLKLSGSGKLASSTIDVGTGATLTYYNITPQNTSPLTFNINGGTLEFYNDRTASVTHSDNNAICAGGTNQDVTIYGTGATLLIDGGGCVAALNNNQSNITFALDSNSVIYVKSGYFVNGGYATQNWDNNEAELRLGAAGKVELWDGKQMRVGGLSGEAGAQIVESKGGNGIVIGNGVTSDQSYTYNGTISLNGKTFDYVGEGKQTLNGDITKANMYSKGGTLILGTAGNDMKINSGVFIKEDGGEVQVDGNLIVESDIFRASGTWSTGTGTITLKSGTQMRVGGTIGPTIGIKLDGGMLFNDGDHNGTAATVSSPIMVLSDSQLQCGWSGSLTLSGGLNGSGGLTVNNDSGWTIVTGTGNFSGPLTIIGNFRTGAAGVGTADAPAKASDYIGTGEITLKSVSDTRGIFQNNDNHLTFSNDLNFAEDSYLKSGWSKSMTFTGNIKGSGRLEVLTDSGWVIMGTKCADNAFTGDVQTNWTNATSMGKMRLGADQPFGANAGQGNIYGTLDMNGFSQTFKGLHNDGDKGSIYNNLTTLSTLTLDTTGKDLTFQSSIKGNIALVIKGTGKQTLSKTVAYTGSTTIESGTLALTAASGTNKLYNLSGAGNLDYGSSPLELFNTTDTVFSGKLSGSGKLTFQNGSGWIELKTTADETFTGNIQINYANSNSQGRVRLGADNALGTANRAYIYGTLDMNGNNQSFAGLSNDGNKGPIFNDTDTLSTLTIDNISEDLRFQSSISGNVALVLTGTENGKLTLAKAPEYTGSTTVQAGTLALSQGGTLYNLSGGSADLAAAIDSTGKNLTLENTENTKFIGSIAAAAITKTGEGTLKVNGAITASSLTVTGGEFDLLGSSTGGLTISNAVFSPGNSVGEAEVGGAFTLTDGASVIMEIGGATPDKNDSLVASGNLNLGDGKIHLTFADACDLQPGEQFTAVFSGSNSASIKDNFIDNHVVSDYFINLQYVPYGDGQYAITGILDPNVVPEPSAWILLLFGAFGLMYFRKRK